MLSNPPLAARCALSFIAVVLVSSARADGVTATLAGSHVRVLSTPGYQVPASRLMVGQSSGDVSGATTPAFPTLAADDLDLQSHFQRGGSGDPVWTVDLGDWWDTNGAGPDFFVFEVGGDDALQVAPILPGGALGAPVAVSGWTPTGYQTVTLPVSGQPVHGLCFRLSDLRDAFGLPLSAGQHIEGLRLISAGIDGASFAAVAPDSAGPGHAVLGPAARLASVPRLWSPMEIWYFAPNGFSELAVGPNPFLDFRLQVTFQGPAGELIEVPGFFDGDGFGGESGRIWKARFTPPATGAWTASASFRAGPGVAVSLDPLEGQPTELDGLTLDFQVLPVSATATGFHRKGILRYVGGNYLRFDDGDPFLKGGTDSPENFLAYFDFDGVADSGNLGKLHRYAPHRSDWQPGDPDWVSSTTGEDGRGIIGALNYLSSKRVNSVYMLPMNLGGDGQDVSPYVGQDATNFDRTHFDTSRLLQWNQVFQHAQARGILLHLVLAETEVQNEEWLDGGALGVQRKLYYRELAARFGHHNAIKWNLCEEKDWPIPVVQTFADYLDAVDAYDHPIALHSNLNDLSQYVATKGDPRFSMTSVQYSPDLAGTHVEALRAIAAGTGHPWAVEMDENAPASSGLSGTNSQDLRKRVLWDVYFSGAAGIEWYFGAHALPLGGDQTAEDFSTRQAMWNFMKIAREFMETHLDFESMSPRDSLLTGESGAFGGGEVFARAGLTYAVYYPDASPTGTLDLGEAPGATFVKRWFDPRAGAFFGSSTVVPGGGLHVVGPPPSSSNEDWVLLLARI